MRVIIPYRPRPYQAELHRFMDEFRFGVAVAHRRFGKSVLMANELQKRALKTERPDYRGGFIGPTYRQTKDILWDHLKYYSRVVPGVTYNESELRVDYPNGARVRLYGADNPDSVRGIYLDDAVFDEFDLHHMDVWTSVVRPALSDREGNAYFIGTYKEENGPLGQLSDFALANPETWFMATYPASMTGVLPEEELAQIREQITKEEYAREFECKRAGSVVGSIFGRYVDDAESERRITRVPHDPRLGVTTFWDLGVGDPCAIWFVQQAGAEVRVIDYFEDTGVGLPEYARMLQEGHRKEYNYRRHVAPFDIRVRELGTGKSRYEVAMSLGIHFDVLPQISQTQRSEEAEQISAARLLLPRCWFDAQKCAAGLRALRHWRFPVNDKLGTTGSKAVHDWASHGAKSWCYGALGLREISKVERPKPQIGHIR